MFRFEFVVDGRLCLSKLAAESGFVNGQTKYDPRQLNPGL